ncbi:MAG: TolC family protein [Gracilimonas sp.]
MRILTTITFFTLLLFLGGCASQQNIQRDIDTTGEEAYTDWKAQQEASANDSLGTESPINRTTEPLLDGSLSVADAIKLSLQFNRQLQVELEERLAASGQMLSAIGNAGPEVTASGTYVREEDKSGFVVDGEQVSIENLEDYSATLSVEVPIFSGGNTASALRSAQYLKVLTEKNIQAAIEETIYETMRGYYEVLLLQEELEVAQNLVDLNEQLLQDVINNQDVGIATEFNVLVARVDLSNAQTERQLAQNNVDQARAQLFRILGVAQTSNVEMTDELRFNPTSTNRDEAVERALKSRPEAASSQMNVRIQEEVLRSAYTQYLPTISAFFDNTWGNPNPAFSSVNDWGRFWNAGLRLNWSIFDLSREGEIQQEKANLRQQQISFYDTQEAILFDVQSALLALENARQSVETQQLTLEQGNEGLRQAEVGLREGTLTQVEVQEAQQTFFDAQLSYLNSLYNYEIARLDLQRATGELRFNNRVDREMLDRLQR